MLSMKWWQPLECPLTTERRLVVYGVVKAASQLGDSFSDALNRLRQISHGVGV